MTKPQIKFDRIENRVDLSEYTNVLKLRDQLNQVLDDIASNNGDCEEAYLCFDATEYGIEFLYVSFPRLETPLEIEERIALEKQSKEANKKLAREQKKKREEQEVDTFKKLWKKYNGKVAME
jgi:hypothetical protein